MAGADEVEEDPSDEVVEETRGSEEAALEVDWEDTSEVVVAATELTEEEVEEAADELEDDELEDEASEEEDDEEDDDSVVETAAEDEEEEETPLEVELAVDVLTVPVGVKGSAQRANGSWRYEP